MNPEDMKSAWRDTGRSLSASSPSDEMLEKIRIGKQSTSLDRLCSRYYRFVMLGVACTLLSFSFMLIPELHTYNPIWLSLAFAVYFLTCAIMDFWLYRGVDSIDCIRMPVSEVIAKARYYRKRHLQFIICLLPMVVAVVVLLAFYFQFEREIVLGMLIGGAAGLCIGLYQLRQFMLDYRSLTDAD